MVESSWLYELNSRAVVRHLGREADDALRSGDQERCIDIIDRLYALMDTKFVAKAHMAAIMMLALLNSSLAEIYASVFPVN